MIGGREIDRFCPECGEHTDAQSCPRDGTPTVERAHFAGVEPAWQSGDRFADRYRIEGELGRGQSGVVYAAIDVELGREVALKVLRAAAIRGERDVTRFYREARTLAQLESPHVVGLYDVGIEPTSHLPYLAMHRLRGPSLAGLLAAEGALPPARAANLAAGVARAIAALAGAQIVHRDLKPANLIVEDAGLPGERVVLVDLGLARGFGADAVGATTTGVVLGTPLYMSPEQADGRPVGVATDLYALGCVLYQLLTNEPPFRGDDALTVVSQHLAQPAPELPEGGAAAVPFPAALRTLTRALLAKRPEHRPQDPAVLAGWLDTVAAGGCPELPASLGRRRSAPPEALGATGRAQAAPSRGRRRGTWAWAGGTGALVAAVIWGAWPRPLPEAAPPATALGVTPTRLEAPRPAPSDPSAADAHGADAALPDLPEASDVAAPDALAVPKRPRPPTGAPPAGAAEVPPPSPEPTKRVIVPF